MQMIRPATCPMMIASCLWLGLAMGDPALGTPPPIPLKYKDHNVVLVSFDALQAAHVGCFGYPRKVTPFLDKMATNGFRFSNTMSVASWTVPASMTWFTGVYPSEHRMTNKYAIYNDREKKLANLKELSPGLITLADIMKQNGYSTGGFTGNAGVSGGFGYEQGFDIYYYPRGKFGSIEQSIPRAINLGSIGPPLPAQPFCALTLGGAGAIHTDRYDNRHENANHLSCPIHFGPQRLQGAHIARHIGGL